jgi:thiamine biosynthesis lipoprotein
MRFIAVVILPLLIWGCSPQSTSFTRHQQILTFGTIINITIRHEDNELINQAFKRLETDFQTMHEVWHPWEPSALTRTNQLLQTGHWFTASTSVLPLIQRARELAIQSDHFFNPAIGKLVQQWGFHRHDADQPFTPDMASISELQSNIPNMEDIEFDGISMRGRNPNIQFDPGGIAKGYGIDQAINTLQLMGIRHAIINAGGDLRAIGQHEERPWQIGIQHPRKTTILASIKTLSDESIFTSGDYQRFYMQDNKRRHHIIDPRTGEPVSHTIAVTVIHPDATTADAAATALLAAGKNNMSKVARAMGIHYVLLMTSEGDLFMNQAMQQRLEINENLNPVIHLVEL